MYDITNDVTKILNMNSTAKDINCLLSLDPISGIYILQEWKPLLGNNLC